MHWQSLVVVVVHTFFFPFFIHSCPFWYILKFSQDLLSVFSCFWVFCCFAKCAHTYTFSLCGKTANCLLFFFLPLTLLYQFFPFSGSRWFSLTANIVFFSSHLFFFFFTCTRSLLLLALLVCQTVQLLLLARNKSKKYSVGGDGNIVNVLVLC